MSYNPRRPKMVLADPTHPDFSRYTLRNGTTNPITLQSFYNQPDLTNYVNSQERMAGFYYQHAMKDNRNVSFYDDADYGRSMDTTYRLRKKPYVYSKAPKGRSMNTDARDEISSFRGDAGGTAETFLEMISRNPNLLNTLDKQNKYQQLIERKTKELNEKIPFNIPNRAQVIEDLVKKFMIKQFEKDILETDKDLIQPINEVKERLRQLVSSQLRQEETAVETLGGEATDILPQSQEAVRITQATNLRTRLLDERGKLERIGKRQRRSASDTLIDLFDFLDIPYQGLYLETDTTEVKANALIENLRSSVNEEKFNKLPENIKTIINNYDRQSRGKDAVKLTSVNAIIKNSFPNLIKNRIDEINASLPEVPETPVLPEAPSVGAPVIIQGAPAGAGSGSGVSESAPEPPNPIFM